jgi:hypothetical protein
MIEPSQAQVLDSTDIWQTFGLLAAFVAQSIIFIWYLSRHDKRFEDSETRSSAAHLEASKMCVEAQRDGHAVMRECVGAMARVSASLERIEGKQ